MKKLAVLGIFVLTLTSAIISQEVVNLTTPEPSNTNYRVGAVHLNINSETLSVYLVGVNGENLSCSYNSATNPTGIFLITALNKANLSSAYTGNATTGSLKQRIFHRLVVMGEALQVCGRVLTGTIAGTVP